MLANPLPDRLFSLEVTFSHKLTIYIPGFSAPKLALYAFMIQTTPTLSWTCNCPSKKSIWIALCNTLWAFLKGGHKGSSGGWIPRSPPWSPEHTHALICNHVHGWSAIILSSDVMKGVERWCNICFLENAQTLWPCLAGVRCGTDERFHVHLWLRMCVQADTALKDIVCWCLCCDVAGYCLWFARINTAVSYMHSFTVLCLCWTLGGNWKR